MRGFFNLSWLEVWAERPDYLSLNGGRGACNTGWGREVGVSVICSLGGIGCNVNHPYVELLNRRNP